MLTPDPYQSWSGAPKHWVQIPAQRQGPPGPAQLDAALRRASGEWGVAAVALGVAVAAFVLIGTGGAVTDCEATPVDATNGAPVR